MTSAQDDFYTAGFDYEAGSPHLRHPRLRRWIDEIIEREALRRPGPSGMRLLEIGAGHGHVTDLLAGTGAQVVVTEMSSASCEHLTRRFAANPRVQVLFDPSGDRDLRDLGPFDLVVAVSVLHHIVDYLAALRSWTDLLAPGGALVTFADPLWYPRRSRSSLAVDRGAYYAWRVFQGDLATGARSFLRRARGRMDENNSHDMVEYHVLRQGCDEQAVAETLRRQFDQVEVVPYWSTPSAALQRLGDRAGWRSTFGIVARDFTPDPG